MKEKRFLLMLSCINGVLLALMAAAVHSYGAAAVFFRQGERIFYLSDTYTDFLLCGRRTDLLVFLGAQGR